MALLPDERIDDSGPRGPAATAAEEATKLLTVVRVGHCYDAHMTEAGVEIRDESANGDLVFALVVEGKREATARASADVLDQMGRQLGVTPDGVASELRSALERLHTDALDKVEIAHLKEDPAGSRRFVASYVFRDFRQVGVGVIWYDLTRGETGPGTAPTLARNKLRYVVHANLVGEDPAAESLRKALR